jgi:hypothetical protein
LSVVGGALEPGDDASEARWFARDELPPDDEIGFANVREILRDWRETQA